MGFLNALLPLFEAAASSGNAGAIGLIAIGAGLAVCTGSFSSIGEGLICCHAIDGMVRNPEQAKSIRSTMILAVALDESCGIYALIVAILIIFVLPGQI
ncbi:MAG: F0F1 ATP synthase subunit C [Bacilli bacterium]|nr:F0F1 ATP synthase subunit C [Bacilli bacterium]